MERTLNLTEKGVSPYERNIIGPNEKENGSKCGREVGPNER